MNSPKNRNSQLNRMFPGESDQNLRDKQLVEALRKRLNLQLEKNPALCKKAAALLSEWINQKKK